MTEWKHSGRNSNISKIISKSQLETDIYDAHIVERIVIFPSFMFHIHTSENNVQIFMIFKLVKDTDSKKYDDFLADLSKGTL